ncbi:hypothetical protein L6452_07659 [Arctium lappa]|uniref:Uncharacterized protein n=1 Tax=Arctium lappa TaxID=4217 RepID=A0ACB9EMK0_ARCLA|nr:hypothetical protein L6452_07659 [Arctium lappa]
MMSSSTTLLPAIDSIPPKLATWWNDSGYGACSRGWQGIKCAQRWVKVGQASSSDVVLVDRVVVVVVVVVVLGVGEVPNGKEDAGGSIGVVVIKENAKLMGLCPVKARNEKCNEM